MKTMSCRFGVVLFATVACTVPWSLAPSSGGTEESRNPTVNDNDELAEMFRKDQSDRMPFLKPEQRAAANDWFNILVLLLRDTGRRARVKELYEANQLKTGADYYYAAMVLQHGSVPEDFLLAHELCVAAICKGEKRARWLAAASEDRFLMNIGRAQRFGTQFRSDGLDKPLQLYKVGTGVTDNLRRALDVPSIEEAKAREAEINAK